MREIGLILPNQLFLNHPLLNKKMPLLLLEDSHFFNQYQFHKQKIIFHRASMQAFRERIASKYHSVDYLESGEIKDNNSLFNKLQHYKVWHLIDPVDLSIKNEWQDFTRKKGIDMRIYPSPGFLNSQESLFKYFSSQKKYYLYSFYIHQRKKRNILTRDSKPLGGKWSYDKENRRTVASNIPIPEIKIPLINSYVKEASKYVQKYFSKNPGKIVPFIYPVTHQEAQEWMNDFFAYRLQQFGDYQDAVHQSYPFLFHSLISPLLNSGLLTIDYVLSKADDLKEKIPLNSLEGFIRQVIGWREYIRAIYLLKGNKQRNSNFWKHYRKIPRAFWEGNTDIFPIDFTVEKIKKYAYAHHIERLMVLGNFMLLTEIDPVEVYRWFMMMFIDAYEWVMIPNVFGMSQFADGGLMSTKPYFSSSNYIRKMTNYEEGKWCDIWDGLYWRFIKKHQSFFDSNPRTRLIASIFRKKDGKQLNQFIKKAEDYLRKKFYQKDR